MIGSKKNLCKQNCKHLKLVAKQYFCEKYSLNLFGGKNKVLRPACCQRTLPDDTVLKPEKIKMQKAVQSFKKYR